jgi:hypothetical protein
MITRSRKHFTAWLGIIAMWLVVIVPTVSQLVAAAGVQDLVLPICSLSFDGSGQQEMVVHHVPTGDQHSSQAGDLSACGYCNLLEHHATLPTVMPPQPAAMPLVVVATVAPLSTSFTPTGAFPSGRPRDPPRNS